MTGRKTVSSHPRCIREGCRGVGVHSFMSDPDDKRCGVHHQAEERRRIAAIEAARQVFLVLVGGGRS